MNQDDRTMVALTYIIVVALLLVGIVIAVVLHAVL